MVWRRKHETRAPAWAVRGARVRVSYKGSNIDGYTGTITKIGYTHPDRVEVRLTGDKHGRPCSGTFERQPLWLNVAWLVELVA